MPGQGRKRSEGDLTPVIEGDIVPTSLKELEGEDELDDAVEMAEDDEDDEDDEDEDDEDDDDDDDEDEDEDEDAVEEPDAR